jgi:hypothetical protein
MHGSAGQNWGRIGVAAALVIMALGSTATPIAAQGLEDYDYNNLGLRGIGAGLFYVDASQNDGELGFEGKVDLGFLGPNIRIVPRVGYWKADVEASQVTELEMQLEEASGLEPGTISLGDIKRSAYIIGTDFQWTVRDARIAPYIGLGLDVYILNDDGDAIQDTFLDDLIVTAGVSGVVGAQVALSRRWSAYGEFRGTAVTDASNVGLAFGLFLMTGN